MKKKVASLLTLAFIASCLTGCKSDDYKKGVELQETGDYQGALEIYESIDDYENYKDTAQRVSECETMIETIDIFDKASKFAEQKNSELDTAVSEAEVLVAEKQQALDDTLTPALETAISETKAKKTDHYGNAGNTR